MQARSFGLVVAGQSVIFQQVMQKVYRRFNPVLNYKNGGNAMQYFFIILTLISLSANGATNKSKAPSKKETQDFIINKMYQCKDNVDFPTSVEIKGGILMISHKNFNYTHNVPMDLIKSIDIYYGGFTIEMKGREDVKFNLIDIHGQRVSGSQDYLKCSNQKWYKGDEQSEQEIEQLKKAFKHFNELNNSESNLFK